MTSKELKKLTRQDLLELLLEQEKENERLRAKIDEQDRMLKSREISMTGSGTMAEAALKLNKVYEAVDAACAQYIENMKNCDAICQAKIAEAEAEAARIREEAWKNSEDYLSNVLDNLKAVHLSNRGKH